MKSPARPMHAMVLAAGRGERMRPLTDTTPKPLLMVRGQHLIAWHLHRLRAAGFVHVVINVAHLGQQIIDAIGTGAAFGLDVRFSVEPEGAFETAGGIATAEPWRDGYGQLLDSPFLVINADVWTDWPMQHAIEIRDTEFTAQHPTRCHLVLVDNPPHHPQGDFCLQTPGQWPSSQSTLEHDRDRIGPRAVGFRDQGSPLTFSGIGVYDRRMFAEIRPRTRAALAPLLRQAITDGLACGSHYTGVWNDVGTPQRLAQLNTDT